MVRGSVELDVKKSLADATGTRAEDWFLVFKARYGMQVVFEAIAEVRGVGEVVTQIFTCNTAVDPILMAGMKPVYAEITSDTVAIDVEKLVVGEDTRAVVVQNSFGIIGDGWKKMEGVVLVEDSAHCVGRMMRDAGGKPVADVSVHSYGVEKILGTKFGGAVWVNPKLDKELRERMCEKLGGLLVVKGKVDYKARTYRPMLRVLGHAPGGAGMKRKLTNAGLFEAAIVPMERKGKLPYRPMKPSAWMCRKILLAMEGLSDEEKRRVAVVRKYIEGLAGLADKLEIPAEVVKKPQPLVRFPFFVGKGYDADAVVGELTERGVYAGKWYRPALFPGVDDKRIYKYKPGSLPVSEDLVTRVVNLPVNVSLAEAEKIIELVKEVLA